MTAPLLSADNLTITFKEDELLTPAVKGVSFDIMPGEVLALVGESGSGKTLTALAILQLLPVHAYYHQDSHIWFQGKDLLNYSPHQMRSVRGSKIAIVFQEPMTSLNPVLTVGHQISEVLIRHKHLSGYILKTTVINLLEQVGIDHPTERYREYPHQLSGGQKQRVMIAMAIATEPDLLIADEPTTALDVTIQAQILELLMSLQRKLNMAMLLITHDLGVVKRVAERVAVMYQGKLVEIANVADFFIQQQHPYSRKLFSLLPKFHLQRDDILQYNPETTPVLQVRDLHINFAQHHHLVHAVDGISFELYPGETLAVVGESGSGKTTTGRGLLQLIPISGGKIQFKQQNLLTLHGKKLHQLHKQIQIIFQDPFSSMNPRMLVGDIIMEGMKAHHMYPNAHARIERVEALLVQVGLPPESRNRYPHQFSGGQRQRICIARALAVEPEIIICDEPTSALDVSVQAQIIELLKKLQVELGLSYIFISHNIAIVSYLADRILVMYQGVIVESGETLAVLNNPQHAYTRQLLASVLQV